MAEPTGVLTLEDLIIEVARSTGTAFYGTDGTQVAQVPSNVLDLDEATRHVNNGIRKFIADGPQPEGWRWTRPVGVFDIWGTDAVSASITVTAVFDAIDTVYTASQATFFETMEQKAISVTGELDVFLDEFVSTTVMRHSNEDTSFVGSKTFTITTDGNYTLPLTFGGAFRGMITFVAATNQSTPIKWTSEGHIRRLRENRTVDTGDPRLAAVRPFNLRHTPTNARPRRWELLLYPTPDEDDQVEFPFDLYFNDLTSVTEVHPAPFLHDDAIRAACLAVAELDVDDIAGPKVQDYQTKLANSWRIDRQATPPRLGHFGAPRRLAQDIRDVREFLDFQEVIVNP